jgi:hypothetical protein
MKRFLLVILAAGLLCPAFAQRVERTYVTTDRSWYAAGETVYLSAFCVDVSDGVSLSDVSAVAYLELTSAQGMAVSGKVALLHGRGAGTLVLPQSLPTGNYRLSAYTALSKREEGYDARKGSRIISVYNTLSTARVTDAVVVEKAPAAPKALPNSPAISAELSANGQISLTSKVPASLSVSVFRNEPLAQYGTASLGQILDAPASSGNQNVVPEFDGEILTLHLTQTDGQPIRTLESQEVFISRPGHLEDIYSGQLQADGSVRFYTCNFFGPGDLVVTLEKGAPAFKVEMDSPYRTLAPKDIPNLVLDPSQGEVITRLGARMQVTSAFEADTLYQRLPTRSIAFLSDKYITYVLDDYTRFATLREVFVEYLSDIRTRGRGEDLEMQVRTLRLQNGVSSFRDLPSLILVDGVPVFNHSLIYAMDPALIQRIEVYPYYCTFGRAMYSGVANFVTFKGDLGGIRFGDNVRILNFSGAGYPVAFTPAEDPRYPNQRETLLWQPLLDIQPGETLLLPAMKADEGLVLQVEGLTSDGKPLYLRQEF